MNTQRIRYFRGPNVHAACPSVEIAVDGGPETAAALAQAVVDLHNLVEVPVTFTAIVPGAGGGWLAVAEAPFEPLGLAAAEIATRLVAAGEGINPTADELKRLKDTEYNERLPSSTNVIYQAARKRNIPSRRLSTEYGRLLIHGQGSKQRRSLAAEPDSIGIVARTCSTDKHLAKELMAAAGVPVPQGRAVTTLEEAFKAVEELGRPVAIKPQDADLQIGVSLDLRTREEIETAFKNAVAHSGCVLVERFAPGLEHRVLVVDGKVAAVTRIDPPHVVGDGKRTIGQLVAELNADPRRGDPDSYLPWHKIALDDIAINVLKGQGFTLDSVPPAGVKVLARRNPPYFENGGNFVDQTDDIHPTVAAHAVAAAKALQLTVAGLDIVTPDISQPLEEQGGVVIEINAGPGLWLHLSPYNESPRPVGEAIVEAMFPNGGSGRIPVVALVGGGAAAPRFLREVLALDGLRVGHVGADAVSVSGRQWKVAGGPQQRALQLLQFPGVDAAVLETTPEELLESGFGNDRCEAVVALVPIADGAYLKPLRHAMTPGGRFITADQDAAARLGVAPESLMVVTHLSDRTAAKRGIALGADGTVVVAESNGAWRPIGKWPKSVGAADQLALLGALAAGLSLGIREGSLTSYLAKLR